jgi:citrate synthase
MNPGQQLHQTMTQGMASVTETGIAVKGYDLCADLIGQVSFGDMIFLEVVGRLPTEAESRISNAVLVTLVEHGLTPSALVARLTTLGSPTAIQGAIAAGVLGVGEVFLGAIDDCARLIADIRGTIASGSTTALASKRAVESLLSRGQRVPGLGHPVHRIEDPRATRLFGLADAEGTAGIDQEIICALRDAVLDVSGRPLPINADGACAAVMGDLGFPWHILRGYAAVSRAAGILGHLIDEQSNPVGQQLQDLSAQYGTFTESPPLFTPRAIKETNA